MQFINCFWVLDMIWTCLPVTQGMILLTATDFGIPQRRTRLFILGVNKARASAELINTPEKILDTALTTYLPLFKTDPLPVEPFSNIELANHLFVLIRIHVLRFHLFLAMVSSIDSRFSRLVDCLCLVLKVFL